MKIFDTIVKMLCVLFFFGTAIYVFFNKLHINDGESNQDKIANIGIVFMGFFISYQFYLMATEHKK